MKIIGKTFADNSILLRCDCTEHIIEIAYQNCYHGQETLYYVNFIGWYNNKNKYPDFYFCDKQDFLKFLSDIIYLCDCEESNNSNSFFIRIDDTEKGRKIRGTLDIYKDEFDYICIERWKNVPSKRKKKEKVIWDVCISNKYLTELKSEIENLKRLAEENGL